ncbi:MAG: hypothetical protein PHU53_06775, partial [Thermoplasmata archaeon]|nr:hypothetical protein [Thermoplasmata archaeon]
ISKVLTGNQWSGYVSVSGEAGPMNIDPCVVTCRGDAWLFWSTDSDVISQGDDFDIVCRVYGPDGWENTVTEIVAIPDSGNDTGPAATVQDDLLVLTWISDSYELDKESETDTDIILCAHDGEEWSTHVSVSYNDGYRNDGGGATHRTVSLSSFDGRVIIVWETNASPLLTETTNTWLMFSDCEFPEDGFDYYWLAVPLIIAVAAVIYLRARKKS